MEGMRFKNEGVLIRERPHEIIKMVRTSDKQLTGTWTPEQLVDREVRALERLKGIDGVPQFIAREADDTFSMSEMQGADVSSTEGVDPAYFERLRALVKEIHGRGVYRFGQNKRDYLVLPDGSPGVIDFGNVCFREENPALAQMASLYTSIRLADLERRFSKKQG